ncbi:MAG: tRNA (N6-threonylcarbamoyladenosine(37)-N6)-methyltransferase TrmO [Peptococcaceae bacterium]|jgi:tRNA-Thr(GGU) m(6)t(6)A37 methyltransferase TsaA|nr:tRNA (N6-threonylcarbamoyladenosine(37)-N6)-methyltransferase TrmO [Peptococcaceae bacterium]
MKVIGHIHTDFSDKFGIPRQSGLVPALQGRIVFAPEFRTPEAVRGLEQFSHIWLLWQFSENEKEHWSATVRPPRLDGNTRVGVFATRSPFRPNPIGLSSVRLERITYDENLGPILWVSGADLLDGTPIYDVKPYIPYTDCHPDATEGYTKETKGYGLQVDFPAHLLQKLPAEKQGAVLGILAQDPRPAYHHDPERIYGVSFAGFDVRFTVDGDKLTVCDVIDQAAK